MVRRMEPGRGSQRPMGRIVEHGYRARTALRRQSPLVFSMLAAPAQAQWIDCIPASPPPALVKIPELISDKGVARHDHSRRRAAALHLPPAAAVAARPVGNVTVRTAIRAHVPRRERGAAAARRYRALSRSDARPDPAARVGDIIQLTFLNQIDPVELRQLDRPRRDSRPAGLRRKHPAPAIRALDKFPDCFHGSSTGNIHFHGTHTNPNTTGDNVFIEVRPSLRDGTDEPIVTAATRAGSLRAVLRRMRERSCRKNVLSQWPHDLERPAAAWTAEQEALLKQYDSDPAIGKKLWPVERAADRGRRLAAILHRRVSLLLPPAGIHRQRAAAAHPRARRPWPARAGAADGTGAGHALVSRAQARLDHDQRRRTA